MEGVSVTFARHSRHVVALQSAAIIAFTGV
jgi:hypothetical protein